MNQDLPQAFDTPSPDCLLTLAMPLALEEEMLDLLRQHADLVPGFSVLHGHGLGADATLSTMMERVEGRARRVFVSMPLHQSRVPVLLARLRPALGSPQVLYWAVPLLASGSLA